MNCRDVTWILDNQKGGLDPARRRDLESHVAGCAQCASAWHLQSGLAALPGLSVPADFLASCRQLVASAAPSAYRRPAIQHPIFWSTLTAVAAAAALLFFMLPRQPSVIQPAGNEPPAAMVDPAPATLEPASAPNDAAPDLSQVATIEPPIASGFLVRVLRPGSRADTGDNQSDSADLAIDEQLRAYQNEPSTKQAVDSFYDALMEELRHVPGLTLVESDLRKLEPASSRKYQLGMGAEMEIGLDGKVVRRNNRYIPVRLNAEQIRSNGKSVIRMMTSTTIDLQAPCTGASSVADAMCPDPRGAAATLVRTLRQDVFPPDSSAIRALQAGLQDTSLDSAQRSKLLFDLLKVQDNTDDLSLLRHPGVVRSTIDLAASADPAMRARLWRAMRGVGNKDLIPPLMNSVVNDSVDVRLAALETLADFRDDGRVRSTLESIGLGDSRPLVRAVVERSLSGEDSWKRYVIASLKDSSRPAPERVEALVYYLYPPGPQEDPPDNPQYFQIMEELLDDGALAALADTLPDAGSLRNNAGILMSNIGYRFNKNPAITEMLLGVLQHDPKPRMRTIAGEVLARTHGSEPRVREVLNKAIQSDPDPSVQNWIRQILASRENSAPVF